MVKNRVDFGHVLFEIPIRHPTRDFKKAVEYVSGKQELSGLEIQVWVSLVCGWH